MQLKVLSDVQVPLMAGIGNIPGDASLEARIYIHGWLKWLIPLLQALRAVTYRMDLNATWTRSA